MKGIGMARVIAGFIGGLFAGSCCAFIALLILAPMGGSQMNVSALPFLVCPSLAGGLIAQSLILALLK
jgi:hypothetical protein